ncbi:hypothetical protein [Rhodococcus sp. NPDC127528]
MTTIRLDAPHPFDPDAPIALLAAHAIPGAEQTDCATATHLTPIESP